MTFVTPEWVKDAIFYHIFPERFANGDPTNDPPGTMPWGSVPTNDCFMGGDLQGVMDRLPYLQELGVTAIYFNPIFKARSNHKFDHGDYMRIDPHFGTNELFIQLVDQLHEVGIRVILDISHNHSGREFYAFHDVVQKGEDSPYKDWYDFRGFPVSDAETPNYRSWWGIGTLPEFNTDNPQVRKYFKDVTRYWMEEAGIDGWRLDVANEVPHDYWAEWRELVKSINPDAYTVGEIWGDGLPWLRGDNFDAVMNYVWRDAVFQFFLHENMSASAFHQTIRNLLDRYGPQASRAMFNLLGSHDTPRVITEAEEDLDKVRLAFLYQMTYVGAPVIYYGDEIGLTGGKDPGCRKAFPWNKEHWNVEWFEYVKRLIKIRHNTPALRSLTYEAILTDDDNGIYVYQRGEGEGAQIIAINPSDEARKIRFHQSVWGDRGSVIDQLTSKTAEISDGNVEFAVGARDGVVLSLNNGA